MYDTKFYTVEEFAKLLNVSRQTIWRNIRSGHLKAFRVGAGPRSPFRIPAYELIRMQANESDEI